MPKLPAIRTPWHQHLRRVRYQLVPVLSFVAAAVLVVWLWGRQSGGATTVGEVEAVRVELTAPADGVLAPLSEGPLELFGRVGARAVVARLDEGPSLALLEALQEERNRLRKELAATAAQVQQDLARVALNQATYQERRLEEARRLALDAERCRLDVLDRKAQVETDRIEYQRQCERYEAMKRACERGAATEYTLSDLQLQRDVVAQRIKSNLQGLAEAEKQCAAVLARHEGLTKAPSLSAADHAGVDTFLEPIRAAVSAQAARMRELRLRIDSLTIRTPIAGAICEIYRRPGQAVRTGDPILAVGTEHTSHIVSYVRDSQLIGPHPGMQVTVAIRGVPRRTVLGKVEQVGPQISQVPPHHLRDTRVPEWGLPVRISLKEALSLRPGELVDVIFKPVR